jgi:hypothetical protein
MSQTTLKLSVLATLLLLTGGISARAADETFTVRIENVSAANALTLSNGKTEPVGVAPVLSISSTPIARRSSHRVSPTAARDLRPWRRTDLRARSRNL